MCINLFYIKEAEIMYNPHSNEVGPLCKTYIKTEYNDLQTI